MGLFKRNRRRLSSIADWPVAAWRFSQASVQGGVARYWGCACLFVSSGVVTCVFSLLCFPPWRELFPIGSGPRPGVFEFNSASRGGGGGVAGCCGSPGGLRRVDFSAASAVAAQFCTAILNSAGVGVRSIGLEQVIGECRCALRTGLVVGKQGGPGRCFVISGWVDARDTWFPFRVRVSVAACVVVVMGFGCRGAGFPYGEGSRVDSRRFEPDERSRVSVGPRRPPQFFCGVVGPRSSTSVGRCQLLGVFLHSGRPVRSLLFGETWIYRPRRWLGVYGSGVSAGHCVVWLCLRAKRVWCLRRDCIVFFGALMLVVMGGLALAGWFCESRPVFIVGSGSFGGVDRRRFATPLGSRRFCRA